MTISTKRQPFGLYPAESPRLFVPHEDMRLVHEASTPTEVARRAGLSPRIYQHWRWTHGTSHPWLLRWIYGDDCPVDGKDFPFSSEMHKFRNAAQVKSIAAASVRKPDFLWVSSQPRREKTVPTDMIHYWLRDYRQKYRGQDWFEGWLLRGEDPPPHITIPKMEEVRRCARAWDYVSLARAARMRRASDYELWFRRATIPVGQDRSAWLLWLYSSKGYRRAPAFVVVPKLQAYRRRGSAKAIRKAARLNERTVRAWRRDPMMWAILEEVIDAARRGGNPNSEAFRSLSAATQEAMRRYAASTTRTARCKAAGLHTVEFDTLRREAEDRGVNKELQDFLDYRGNFQEIKLRRKLGLLNGKLFVPSDEFCTFHERAAEEWVRQGIAPLVQLPGFDAWFLAWVTPADPRGRRRALAAAVATTPISDGKLLESSPSPPKLPSRTETTQPPRPRGRPPSKDTAEVYSFCFEHLRVEGKKASAVLDLAIRRFGEDRAPKNESDVRNFARRHAERLVRPASGQS
jgi:hypothetical protein